MFGMNTRPFTWKFHQVPDDDPMQLIIIIHSTQACLLPLRHKTL